MSLKNVPCFKICSKIQKKFTFLNVFTIHKMCMISNFGHNIQKCLWFQFLCGGVAVNSQSQGAGLVFESLHRTIVAFCYLFSSRGTSRWTAPVALSPMCSPANLTQRALNRGSRKQVFSRVAELSIFMGRQCRIQQPYNYARDPSERVVGPSKQAGWIQHAYKQPKGSDYVSLIARPKKASHEEAAEWTAPVTTWFYHGDVSLMPCVFSFVYFEKYKHIYYKEINFNFVERVQCTLKKCKCSVKKVHSTLRKHFYN